MRDEETTPSGTPSGSPSPADVGDEATVESTLSGRETETPTGNLLVGVERFGPYRLLRPLGHGGMGEVYEAVDERANHVVAIKVLPRRSLATDPAKERFLREGKLAASINHPNSLYVYGTEEVDGFPLISMELAAGGTLKDRIESDGPMSPVDVARAGVQIAAGLAAAAEKGVLHRDVKPSNCFVDDHGVVKVGDFGLSVASADAEEMTQLTRTGSFLGTPAYASPEQIRGGTLDERSDVYSVGATLYYLLTGHRLFPEETGLQLMAAILEKDQTLAALGPDVPRTLRQVLMRCLAKDPAQRFASHADLRRALQPIASTIEDAAPLKRRFVGFLVDTLILGGPYMAIGLIGGSQMQAAELQTGAAMRSAVVGSVLTYGVTLAYAILMEGLRGATVGQSVMGLRIVDSLGEIPGLRRAAVRSLVYQAPAMLTVLGAFVAIYLDHKAAVGVLSGIGTLVPALHYITCRKANGKRAIHELASGTRTAIASRPSERVALTPQPAPELEQRVGPYAASRTTEAAGDFVFARDAQLRRDLWLRLRDPADPPTSPERRRIDREGRLRWMGERRQPNDAWDAFQAVSGRPLLDVVQTPRPWPVVRLWLRDLAEEWKDAGADGTLDFPLSLDRVWVGSRGRAVLCEGSPGKAVAPVAASPSKFLLEVANVALTGDRGAGAAVPARPLGFETREFLRKLENDELTAPDPILEALGEISADSGDVSPRRRFAQTLSMLMVPLLLVTLFTVIHWTASQTHTDRPELFQLNGLWNMHEALSALEEPSPEEERRLAAVHTLLGGPFRHEGIKGTIGERVRVTFLNDEEIEGLEALWAELPAPEDAEVAAAEEFLRDQFAEWRAWQNRPQSAAMLAALEMVTTLSFHFVAPISLLLVLVGLGPLTFRMFGLAVVRPDGARAGRFRVLGRTLLTWIPAAVVWFAIMGGEGVYPLQGSALQDIFSHAMEGEPALVPGLALALIAVGLGWSILRPGQGPQDLLSGTRLVTR